MSAYAWAVIGAIIVTWFLLSLPLGVVIGRLLGGGRPIPPGPAPGPTRPTDTWDDVTWVNEHRVSDYWPMMREIARNADDVVAEAEAILREAAA